MGGGDGDGGDGGGFGAEDAGAEGDGLPLMRVKREISSGVQPPSGPMAMAWVIRTVKEFDVPPVS